MATDGGYLMPKKRKVAEVIQFDEPYNNENVLECKKCGFQLFFIHMVDTDDITHFECGREGCSEIIEFNTITLTEKDVR